MKKATRRSTSGVEDLRKSVGNFSTRFSLPSFVKRVEKLTDVQKIEIKRMGFGNLLEMPNLTLNKNLLVELMERWSCEKLAFKIAPGEITISLMDVALILGLRVTGDPVSIKEDEPFSKLEQEYGATLWKRKITIASIDSRLESLGGMVNEDFIRLFLLFTFGTFLFPNANGKVDSRYLSLLKDLDKVCCYAWGSAVLEVLSRWLCKRKDDNVQYVGGCLLLLQIWSYEHIDIARPSLHDCYFTFPRACRWNNCKSHQRQWLTNKFKELQKNQMIWKLQLTSEESEMDIIKELLEAQKEQELPRPQPSSTDASGFNVVELDFESDMEKVREEVGEQEEMEQLKASQNVSEVLIITKESPSTSCYMTEIQKEKELPRPQPSSTDASGLNVVNLDYESDMEIVNEEVKVQEETEQLRPSQNVSEALIDSIESPSTSCHVLEIQKEHAEHPSTGLVSSSNFTDGNEDELRTRNHILEEEIMELKKEIDELRRENKLLRNQPPLEEENVELKKEVETLRRENQLLSVSSNNLVVRLEKLLFDEDINATEER